jgi:hypothetical protein
MKIISLALFNHPSAKPFERLAYIRGAFWNCRMARLLYPEYKVKIHVDQSTFTEFEALFNWLNNTGVAIMPLEGGRPLCEMMLWRMKPCFEQDVTHVLCRDADALVTYREAQRVQQWLEGGKGLHCIHDAPGHAGLMGGLTGFDTAKLKAATSWQTWDQMIIGWDLSQRGSDQNLLNQRVLPHMESELHIHGATDRFPRLPNVDAKYWESDLTVRHAGSAGVVEMETIRFFKRLDEYDYVCAEIQAQFPKLFYWV